MANFTSSSSSTAPFHSDILSFTAASSSAAFDDGAEDSCSICLEPFSADDPATVTSCNHAYHLHCILEWYQRSKECPLCWQLLVLKDPGSHELLKVEKYIRSRCKYLSASANSRSSLEGLNANHIMQRLAASASRACFFRRRERQRSSGAGPSDNSSSTLPSGGSSPTSGVPSTGDIQHSRSALSPGVEAVARNTTPENDVPSRPSLLPSENVRRQNASEVFTLPESFKSKLSAASSKYKESITKSTRGLKEKLFDRNTSVKELNKEGVQREVNAGIASVAWMIERLEFTSKRSSTSLIPNFTGGTSSFPLKGKTVQENGAMIGEDIGAVVRDVNSDSTPLVFSMVTNQL